MEQQNEAGSGLFEIAIDNTASGYLREAAKWAKFLAILGFIGCGFMAVASLFVGGIYSGLGRTAGMAGLGAMMTITYLGLAVLYFFPVLYLYNFASRAQAALRGNDQNGINESFRNLKRCFKFVGILTIVCMALAVLAIVAGIAFGSMFASRSTF